MADLSEIRMTIKLTNPRAVRALTAVVRTLAEMADRYPYDADLRRAVRAGKYAVRHLRGTIDDIPPP